MSNSKLAILGIIIVVAIAFGWVFWSELSDSQQELANPEMILGSENEQVQNNTSASSLEADLEAVNLNEIDEGADQIQKKSLEL